MVTLSFSCLKKYRPFYSRVNEETGAGVILSIYDGKTLSIWRLRRINTDCLVKKL